MIHWVPLQVGRSYGSISFAPREELIVFAYQIWKPQFLSVRQREMTRRGALLHGVPKIEYP